MFGINHLPDATTETIAQRNYWWAMLITRMIIEREDVRASIPDNATLYVLPSNDPELCAHNRRLRDESPTAQAIVLVEVTVTPAHEVTIRPFAATGPSMTYQYA